MYLAVSRNVTFKPVRVKRGQTLIVALAVLFVLLFLGALFVAMISRNLAAAGRSRDTQGALSLAEAGVRYCDSQLTNSLDGADWRPVPDLVAGATNPQDPDAYWISQGYSRINQPGGRYLIRVTYQPRPDDPRSQFIKIESVGRSGDLGNLQDPTVFVQTGAATPRLRREMIAYKQMGLPDYLLYVTNKDDRKTPSFIGVPNLKNVPLSGGVPAFGLAGVNQDFALQLGDPTIATATNGVSNNNLLFGGGVRINSDVELGGNVFVYLSPRGNADPMLSPERFACSGSITLIPNLNTDNGGGSDTTLDSNDLTVFVNQQINSPFSTWSNPAITSMAIRNSDDATFTTASGLVRDGRSRQDSQGYGNSTPSLPAPRIDSVVDNTGVLRYQALTRDSGENIVYKPTVGPTQTLNTGQMGWGRGIYINNVDDLQPEGTGPGGYSMRADWLNPHTQGGHWNGQFYTPPGVQVELEGDRIRLTRLDNDVFRKPDGSPITAQGGKIVEIPLADEDRASYQPDPAVSNTKFALPPLEHDDGSVGVGSDYGVNVVLYAEGNVRVRGFYGKDSTKGNTKLGRVHITIVTGGTAYIDGNVVKADPDRASTCAVLAKDYVCLNTTMFFSPENQNTSFQPVANGNGFFTSLSPVGTQPDYDFSYSCGVDPALYKTGKNSVATMLLLRHAAFDPGPAYINVLINPATNAVLSTFPNGLLPAATTEMLGMKYANNDPGPVGNPAIPLPDKASILTEFRQEGIVVFTPPFAVPQLMRIQYDQTAAQANGASDYALGGAAVVPLDIRIEALLYAQERSFFVIPGYPLNQDPRDTRESWNGGANQRPGLSFDANGQPLDDSADLAAKALFPFQDDPIDVRITVCGAITQNYTASPGDQAAWLARWGYIPAEYGSSGTKIPDMHLLGHDPASVNPGEDQAADYRTDLEKSEGITRGLRFEYDPAFAMPYLAPTAQSTYTGSLETAALRKRLYLDTTGKIVLATQILPAVPKLPVCPGLVYFGESDHTL